MILGLGVDLVETARLGRAVERWGARLLTRLFTEAEREYCEGRRERIACYAARLAAKEAAFKALGAGLGAGLRWRDAEVGRDGSGRPLLRLLRRAAELAEERGVRRLHLTLSHTSRYAVAQVILEGGEPASEE